MSVRSLALVLSVLCLAASALAQEAPDAAEWLRRGVDAYRSGMEASDPEARRLAFEGAALAFARAREEGARSPSLELGLGNAALQGGRLGDAVLAYRRSLLLDPARSAARENLKRARELLPAWVPRPADEEVWIPRALELGGLPVGRMRQLAALFFALAGGLAAAAIHRSSPPLRAISALFCVAFLGTWVAIFGASRERVDPSMVITQSEVRARAADSHRAETRLPAPLPAGTEVSLVEERESFVRVRLADGAQVWLPSSALTKVTP